MSATVSEAAIDTLFRDAESAFGRGDFAAALDGYTELLRQRLAERRQLAERRCQLATWIEGDRLIFERLADLCVLFGYVDTADELFAAMADVNRRAGDVYGADYATVKRIHVLLGRGRLHAAFTHLETIVPETGDIDLTPKGLKRWESGRHWPKTDRDDRAVIFSQLYWAMGGILTANGQYGDGLVVFERGLKHTGETAPKLARKAAIPLRLAAAAAHLEKGDLEGAESHLHKLQGRIDETSHPGFFVRRLELSGLLNQLRGDLGEALCDFEEVVALCRRRGFHHAARAASLHLAHVLILFNSTCEAEDMLAHITQESTDAGDAVTAARAAFLFDLAAARQGSLSDAAPAVKHMLRSDRRKSQNESQPMIGGRPLDLPQATNYLAFFDDRMLAFHWYLGEGRFDVASDLLLEFEETFRATDSKLIALRLRARRGLLTHYVEGESAARQELHAAATGLRSLGLKPELWQVLRFMKSEGENDPVREADALLAEITGSLSGARRANFLLNKWTATEARLAQEIAELGGMKAATAYVPWYRRPFRRWAVMRRLNTLLVRLESYRRTLTLRADGRDAALAEPERPGSLLRRLFSHPWRRATISFLVFPDRVFIVYATWLRLEFGVSPLTRAQLRGHVRSWHEAVKWSRHARDLAPEEVDEEASQTCDKWRDISEELSKTLFISPILDQLPRYIRSLSFVADDVLHGFPFAALMHEGRYLAEHRWALTVDHGLDPDPDDKPVPVATREVLLVGVSRGTETIRALPGVSREIDRLESLFAESPMASHDGVRVLRSDGASCCAVLTRLRQAAIGHLACHGEFQPDRPDQSGLVLVPEPEKVERLSLRDLVDEDFRGLRHVTLSACWSADNFILPGRWILSLPEVLRRAGAGSVLACLWPVDDEVAVAFMSKFYELLASHPRDEALQITRRQCLDRSLGKFEVDISAPYFWAGFNLYGDPDRLR